GTSTIRRTTIRREQFVARSIRRKTIRRDQFAAYKGKSTLIGLSNFV
ncbi:unnamed protein product, partial [Rotaria sp. Silwood2]